MVSEKKITPERPLDNEEKALLESVDDNSDKIVELLQKLVRIDSRNYSEFVWTDRNKIMGFAEETMKMFGFETQLVKVPFPHADKEGGKNADHQHHSNLIANLGRENPAKLFQFNGHLDTVPFTEENWDIATPPLGGVVKDGRLYGRGACDMKSGVVCAMVAMWLLKESRYDIDGDVQLWLTPDEETHGAFGSAYMAEHHFDLVNADVTIIGESSAMDPLDSPAFSVGEKGPQWFELTFYGASGHGSMPKEKSNALNKAVRFMSKADRKLKFPKRKAPLSAFTLLKSILSRYRLLDLPKLMKTTKKPGNPLDEDGLNLRSLFRTTYSFDKIRCGTKVNVIPDKCELEVDFRALPGLSTQDLLNSIADYCTKLGYRVEFAGDYLNQQHSNEAIQKRPKDIDLSIITRGEGSYQDPDTPIGNLLSQSFVSVYQVAPVHFFSSGFTDMGNMREAGMKDIYVFGPKGGNVHEANEFVDLTSLQNVTKFYLLSAKRYLCE